MKRLADHLAEAGMSVDDLVSSTGIDAKTVKAIVTGNYTPSPDQRKTLAASLGISVTDVAWGHAVPVDHLWGHGPQFGRTP